jgi:hypothetical protein
LDSPWAMASTSSPSSRLSFAGPDDAEEILDLLESRPMPGPISVVYTRRPDAYRSLLREGERVRILVARDRDRRRLLAMGAWALRTLHVNGEPAPVAYLFGLRARGDALKSWPVLHRGYAGIGQELHGLGVRHAITTIVASNARVAAMLGRGSRYLPAYRTLGRYDVFALLPGRVRERSRTAGMRSATPDDAGRLAEFLAEAGRTQQFFPRMSAEDLLAGRGGPPIDAFRWLEGRPGEILAAAALWHQGDYRQYRIHGYGRPVAWMRRVARLAPFLGLPRLPDPGEEVRYSTLAAWAARDHDPALLADLLDRMPGADTSFILAGAHAAHPLHEVFRKRRHVAYQSEVFRVHWDSDSPPLADLPLYLECGTL